MNLKKCLSFSYLRILSMYILFSYLFNLKNIWYVKIFYLRINKHEISVL